LSWEEHEFELIPDPLDIDPKFAPQFGDSDIAKLREARRILGKDSEYLDKPLPDILEFPGSDILVQAHKDLAQYATLFIRLGPNPHVYCLFLLSTVSPASIRSTEYNHFSARNGQ
jgi:hypothetical protein